MVQRRSIMTLLTLVGLGDALKGYRFFERCLLFRYHCGDISEELSVVEDDTVLDGVFDSPDAFDFAGFVVEFHPAGGVEDLQVG